ncbi:MAG: squalene--hopene cyclase, partial [Dehalococcoidia bacterium]
FNIYEMSAWSRAIVVPLSMIWALKPHCPVAPWAGIEELRVQGTRLPRRRGAWASFFLGVDAGLKVAERARIRPFRRLAMQRAEAWILQRLEASDGLGAIFPPIINTIIAFRALGRAPDDPILVSQIHALEKLEIEEGETLRVRPCFCPVWDTALALNALVESGVAADDPRLCQAARWLMRREVRRPGDWQVKCPGTAAGGWYFEYANEFYPDCDDTAQAVTSLSKVALAVGDIGQRDRQTVRAIRWLLAMQSRNGGWASFDRDCDRELLTAIPFADHNAMIDPPTVDVTARVLEALTQAGLSLASPAVRRGVAFLLAEQEPDGSWFGRWGCNYLYGTWLALSALQRAGEDLRAPWARKAREWLLSCQNADGGWGELPSSYSDPRLKGQGPSTASQTAWALAGVIAAGAANSIAARRGVRYLLDHQQADGGWRDAFWTGTGFPKVFYLKYHLYATYFPLHALARWLRAQGIPDTGELEP